MVITILIFIIISLVFAIIFSSNRLYCYLFEHKEWDRWKKYIKDIDKFEYCESLSNTHRFVIPNTDISAYIWNDGTCSIHYKTGCICCDFNKYQSNKMKKLLMNKIRDNVGQSRL